MTIFVTVKMVGDKYILELEECVYNDIIEALHFTEENSEHEGYTMIAEQLENIK